MRAENSARRVKINCKFLENNRLALREGALIKMDTTFKRLLLAFLIFAGASIFLSPAPFLGLSVLGTTVISSTILGSTLLGSSVLGSSVLSSTVLSSTVLGSVLQARVMATAYSNGILLSETIVSLVAIGLVIYTEFSHPSYGKINKFLVELRRSLLPIVLVNVVLFGLTILVRIWTFMV